MPKTNRTRSLLVAVAAVVLTASVGLGLHAAGAIAPVRAKDATITIVDFEFQPKTITINQHETVTWTNTANQKHTVTADDGTSFDSGVLSHGDVFGNVFETAGTFTYHCSIHSQMTGTIIVKAVAVTPTPSGSQPPTPPPGTLPPNFKTPVPAITPEPTATPTATPAPTPAGTDGTDGTASGSTTPLVIGALVVVAVVAVALLAAWLRRRPT
jgi:plastocyanin